MTFLSRFLEERKPSIHTGCMHRPVLLQFEVSDGKESTSFSVTFRDGMAIIDERPASDADYQLVCSEEELRAILEGRQEILGPFWDSHLPFDFFWAPSLYAFFFPRHPYQEISPVLRSIYTDSKFYPTTTPFPQGYRLHCLVRDLSLNKTLEIGLAYGGSALFIAAAHKSKNAGQHYAVDPYQASFYGNQALTFAESAGLTEYLSCLPVKGNDALRGFLKAGLEFDFIYIDGDHSVSAVLADFLNANACLRVGGILAFDDSHFPSGTRVLGIIKRHFPYLMLHEYCSDRLKVLRKLSHSSGPTAVRLAGSWLGPILIYAKDRLAVLHKLRRYIPWS